MQLVIYSFPLGGPRQLWVAPLPASLSRLVYFLQADSDPFRLRFGWKVELENTIGFQWLGVRFLLPAYPETVFGIPVQGAIYRPAVQFWPGRIPSPEGHFSVTYWRE